MQRAHILFILIACLLWAMDTLIRYPLVFSGQSVVQIVFWEHILLLFLFSYKLKSFVKKLNLKYLFLFFLLGAGGSALAVLMFTKAFFLAHPTLVVLIQKTQPLFAISLSSLWMKERLSRGFLLWSAGAILSGVIMIYPDLKDFIFYHGPQESFSNPVLGYLMALGASILWGFATVIGKYLSMSKFSSQELTLGRMLGGVFILSPLIYLEQPLGQMIPSLEVLFKISLMAFLSGFCGLLLYYEGLKRLQAKLVTIAEMSFPLWVVILNWLILKKSLDIYQMIGGSLLMVCIYILQRKKT